MLRHERCVVAQLDAIENLLNFPVQQTYIALYHALQNDQFFYRVRRKAALYLTYTCNRLPDGMANEATSVEDFFKNRFGCNSDPKIPVLNNFVATSSNLQTYFLMLVSLNLQKVTTFIFILKNIVKSGFNWFLGIADRDCKCSS